MNKGKRIKNFAAREKNKSCAEYTPLNKIIFIPHNNNVYPTLFNQTTNTEIRKVTEINKLT